MSIGRALNCRKRIKQYITDYDIGDCEPLTRHDWTVLEKIHSVLHSFYEATLCNEGKNDHLGRWFVTLDFIFSKSWDALCEIRDLKRQNPRCPEYSWLETTANSAWLKCEEYYKRADESAAYYAAEVLQPRRKWSWFRQEWLGDDEKRPWIDTAQKAVQQLWEEEYKGKFGAPELTLVSRPRHPNDEFGAFSEHRRIRTVTPTSSDSYQSYISCDPEGQPADDPLNYWNSRIRSQPDLARFALDMLALPVSSAECERIFSSAKLLITSSRNRLHPNIIEANECLRAWFRDEEAEERQRAQESQNGLSGEGSREGGREGDREATQAKDDDWGSGNESDEESDDESDDEENNKECDEESDNNEGNDGDIEL
jgi:hypothetical protein